MRRGCLWVAWAMMGSCSTGCGEGSEPGAVRFEPDELQLAVGDEATAVLRITGPALPGSGEPQTIDVTCGPSNAAPFSVSRPGADATRWSMPNQEESIPTELTIRCVTPGEGALSCAAEVPTDPDASTTPYQGSSTTNPKAEPSAVPVGDAVLLVQCTGTAPATPEVCDNGIDDDADHATDCNDADCATVCEADPRCDLKPISPYGDFTDLLPFRAAEEGGSSVGPKGQVVSAEGTADVLCTSYAVTRNDAIDALQLSCDDPAVFCAEGGRDTPIGTSFVVLATVLAAPVPLSGGTQVWQYAWYLDADGAPGNNYVASREAVADPAAGTDTWIVFDTDTKGWHVEVYDVDEANMVTGRATSDVRVLAVDDTLVAVLSFSDISSASLAGRTSATCWDGFAEPVPAFTFDVVPPVGQPLQTP